jgi:hypothetical protein
MRLGHGKRSIRPAIAKAIRRAFMHDPESPHIISQSPWLIAIVIELVNHQQNDCDKDFTVEHSLSILFDEIAPGTDHYREYYGDREIYSQVYMFDMFSRMDETDTVQVRFVKALREKLFFPWTENYAGASIWTAWKKVSAKRFMYKGEVRIAHGSTAYPITDADHLGTFRGEGRSSEVSGPSHQ